MNHAADNVIDLRDVTALDADAAGTIYGLLRHEDGTMAIVLLDGRQEVLEAQQRQASLQDPVRITGPVATLTVRTQPAIDFDVRGLQVAPSGRYLLLHGASYEDSSVVVMALVDLHGGQPLPAGSAARGRAGGGGGGGGLGTPGPARQKQCRLHLVDPVLFGSRPGLVLYQASWHVHSEEHLVVLTSDSRLRLYHVTHSLAAAEQTLHLVPTSGAAPQRYGLGALGGGGGGSISPAQARPGTPPAAAAAEALPSPDIVAFAFGPAAGWGLFSLMLLGADGLVYALGPVAPFGMRCPAVLLERLGEEEAAAEEWLEAAFGEEAVRNKAAKNRWPVLPHVVDCVSPALIGPLNLRARQELPMPRRAVTLAVSHTLTLGDTDARSRTPGGGPGTPAGPPLSSVGTVVVGFADGRLLSYALVGPWGPAWCECAPQYMSATGTASAAPTAVRYKCTLRGGGGDGGPVTAPRMALLDLVELPAGVGGGGGSRRGETPPPPNQQQLIVRAGGGGGGGRGVVGRLLDDDEDEDEADEDGDGLDVSASTVSAARRAMTVIMQAGISSVSAAPAAGGAVTVWACLRNGGCWRIVLPWSSMLPDLLAGSGPGALPAEPPAPVVTCVYDVAAATHGSMTPAAAATAAGSAAAVGCCLVANPLLGGGGLLVLSAAGALHYFQPPGAASLLLDQQQQAAAASPIATGQQAAASSPAATRLPLASPEQRKAQVEAHINGIYGNLTAPPADRSLPKPPAGAPSPLTVSIPEGLRHLTDCIAALRSKHMAFLHGAAVDLVGRADALGAEAGKHAAAVAELSELAGRLEARQAGLEGRLGRLKQLHDNMVERAGVLTSLHWSLPRPLSRAEVAVRDDLADLEVQSHSLAGQWETVAARARRLCEERRGGAGPAALRMGAVPEAQLEKVHDSIVGQYRGLAVARAALSALEQCLAAAAADRTAEQLERGLGLEAGLGLGLARGLGGRAA